MKIDMNYVNVLEMSEPTAVKTKEDKIFYHQKIVIKGKNEIITLILKSSHKLYNGTIKTESKTLPTKPVAL